MATISVKAPQGYPVGTAVDAYVDPGGDVPSKGKGKKGSGTVAADGGITLVGLSPGDYQVGGTVNGQFISFLAFAR